MTQLPAGWTECEISYICDGADKSDPSAAPDEEFTYIDIGGIESPSGRLLGTQRILGRDAPSRARQRVHTGDVLFSTVRTYMQKTTLVPSELDGAIASTGFSVLRPLAPINSRLVLHAVRHPEFVERITSLQAGSSYPAVRDRDVRRMVVRVPPLAEQGRIVAAIDEAFSLLDAGETALHNTRARLKRMRDSVLNAAVTGQLVPQDPTDTPADKLLAALGVSTPADVDELPAVPPSWVWAQLANLARSAGYGTSVKCGYDESGVGVLRIPNIQSGAIDVNDLKRAPVDAGLNARLLLEAGDLLVVRTNGSRDLIGRCAPVVSDLPLSFASYLIRYRLKPDVVLPQFVSLVLSASPWRVLLESRAASSAGQFNLSLASLGPLAIPVPPIGEQVRIVAEVERQLSFIEAAERAVQAGLARSGGLRRSVLRAAFEGRLVEQDPLDEPASVLLERIAAERAAAAPRRRAPRGARGKVVAS